MRLVRESTGETILLGVDLPIGAGGEAVVLPVDSDATLAAKVYHHPGKLLPDKLAAMLANPPLDPMAEQAHVSIAWPVDILVTTGERSTFAGCLMPRVVGARPIFEYYNPASRRRCAPLFSYRYLLRTARNLCAAVKAIHERGYVIGDVNESNILVTAMALVTIVDTDSFQVPDRAAGTLHRCTVGKPEFSPPELIGTTLKEVDRVHYHDLFGLAVLVFQLLMEGTHPFSGEFTGAGEPPTYAERIAAGHYPYGSRRCPYRHSPTAPSIELLHPTVRALMLRRFEDGYLNPKVRPDAAAWLSCLAEAELQLQTCDVNPQHQYGTHLTSCPWCARRAQFGGRDPFYSREELERLPELRRRTVHKTIPSYATPSPANFNIQPTPLPWPLSIPFPTNQYAWLALLMSLFASIAYLLGFSKGSLFMALLDVVLAMAAAATVYRRHNSGKTIASLALVVGLIAGVDSGTDIWHSIHPLSAISIRLVSPGRAVAFAHGSKYVLTGTERAEDQRLIGGRVQEWDAKSGKLVDLLAEYAGSVYAIQTNHNSDNAFVATSAPMEASQIDMLDIRYRGERIPVYTAGAGQITEAVSPDGHFVAVGNLVGGIVILDARTHQTRFKAAVKGEILSMCYSTDGKLLAVATGSPPGSILDGGLTLFEATTYTPRAAVRAHGSAISAVVFAPGSDTVITAGDDSSIRVWNTGRLTLSRTIQVNGARVSAIVLSPNGASVAAACEPVRSDDLDFTVQILDIRTSKCERKLKAGSARITSLAFSDDGARLASVGLDSMLRIWRLTGESN